MREYMQWESWGAEVATWVGVWEWEKWFEMKVLGTRKVVLFAE